MKKITLTVFTLLLFLLSSKAQTVSDGLRALESDKFEKSKSIFQDLIKNNPKAGENYYYLGQLYTTLDNNDSAAVVYTMGAAADPTSGMNNAGLGELKIRQGKPEEAEAYFTKALASSKKGDVKTMRAIATAYLASPKTVDKALEYANKALDLDNGDPQSFILMGDIYVEKLEGGKAATDYEKAAALAPNDPKPHVRLATIWLRAKNADASRDALKKAIDIDSNYAPAHKSLAQLYYLYKQFSRARAEYNRYLELSEPTAANQRQFVNILFLGGFYAEALEIINEIQPQFPEDPYLYRLKAYCIYEVGEKEKNDSASYYMVGVKSIEAMFTKMPKDKVITNDYVYYGKLLSKTNQDSVAVETLLKAYSQDTTNNELYLEVGKIKFKQKKYDEAADYFQRYVSHKPKATVTDYYYLARAYYSSKQYGKADTAYTRISEIKPDYADAYLYRGRCNSILDPNYKDTLAKNMFEKYIEVVTTNGETEKAKKNLVEAYTYLAVYWVNNNNNAEAKNNFVKVLEFDPENKTAKDAIPKLK